MRRKEPGCEYLLEGREGEGGVYMYGRGGGVDQNNERANHIW